MSAWSTCDSTREGGGGGGGVLLLLQLRRACAPPSAPRTWGGETVVGPPPPIVQRTWGEETVVGASLVGPGGRAISARIAVDCAGARGGCKGREGPQRAHAHLQHEGALREHGALGRAREDGLYDGVERAHEARVQERCGGHALPHLQQQPPGEGARVCACVFMKQGQGQTGRKSRQSMRPLTMAMHRLSR